MRQRVTLQFRPSSFAAAPMLEAEASYVPRVGETVELESSLIDRFNGLSTAERQLLESEQVWKWHVLAVRLVIGPRTGRGDVVIVVVSPLFFSYEE
jgi:hypothetical protein